MKQIILLPGLLLFRHGFGRANPGHGPIRAIPTPTANARTITYTDALLMGLVEGTTEYLPVSSVGHSILVTHVLGLDSAEPVPDRAGQPIMVTHHGETHPLTLKEAADVYNVIIQAGPILAILVLYWRRVDSLLRGALGRDPAGRRLLINLLVAFAPVAVLALLFDNWIHQNLFSYKVVAVGLAAGAVVMLLAEKWRRRHAAITTLGPVKGAELELRELTWKQALFIGLCQCASLWPGTSRSMTTIVSGYFVGLRPARAAEFSFLLGLLTLCAASGHEVLTHGAELRQGFDLGPLAAGIAVATVAALLAVKWLIGWLGQHGLGVLAWYRLALAAVVVLVMWQ